MHLIALAAVLSLLAAPQPQAAEEGGFADRLDRAASGRFDAALLLDVECQTQKGPRRALVYGEGIGLWGGSTQFRIPPEAITDLLARVARAGFASMPERFGGKADGPSRGRGMIVTCRILVRLDDGGTKKEVVQLDRGQQSEPFKRLALDIVGAIEGRARDGVSAQGLGDALRKVAGGQVSPVLLEIAATHGPEAPSPGRPRWLLTVSGGLVETRVLTVEGLSAPSRLRPEPSVLRDLAAVLVTNEFAAMPSNLVAPDFTDLNVRVLGRSKSLQARQFDGARAQGAGQQRLSRILDALGRLQERTAKGRGPMR